MDEYISGEEVARAIDDDGEFLNSYILNELTPFHLKMPQTFEQSCLPCIHAMENGQPDPYRCDTDPDPETYTDVVDGYSRHESCGYGGADDDTIIRRLKRNSFRKNEIETYMRDLGLTPGLPSNAETPAEFDRLLLKDGVVDETARMVMLYEHAAKHRPDWKLRQWGAYYIVLGLEEPRKSGEKKDYGDEYKIRMRRYKRQIKAE